ncbi:stabilizer of axonemal microtubules 1 isoform X2 [Astyanax mexicanus]|uniref:stabilizer of axonemal microtubules 1 isoform X2 n=1 Tax=Astyanax mexicanus TaxID=7994 RepID=UPI0020CAF66E|nr:stabilizer of axonemal microtubules 1 isoform X2 [Astyanax mexicanus]
MSTTATCAAIKPESKWQPLEGEMENKTTFRLDYVPHHVIRRSPKAGKQLYIPPDGTMMLTSTYTEDYREHQVHKLLVNKKTEKYCNPTAKMAPMSLYKEQFKPWCVERLRPFKITDNLQLNQGKFVNTTTFQDDYSAKGSTSPRKNFKPITQIVESLPFDGTTNYKLNYITHPVQSRKPKTKKYRPPSASFHGESTYKQDFKGLRTEAPKPIKPVGNMDFLHKCQRIQRVEPLIHAWEKVKKPFQGTSVMKEDYQPWDAAHQTSIMRVPETAKSLGPSRSEKTVLRYNDKLKAREQPNTCMTLSMHNEEPVLKDSTRHRGEAIKSYPASLAQPPGFEYTGTKAGHKLYHPVGDQETSRKELTSFQRQKICPRSESLKK